MQNACRQHRLRECQLRSRVFSTGYNISALGYFGRHFKPNNCNWLTLLAFPSATARFIKLAVCLQILHQHNLRSACCLFVRASNPPNIMLNCRKMLNCKQFFFLSKLFNFIFLLELFFMHTLLVLQQTHKTYAQTPSHIGKLSLSCKPIYEYEGCLGG